MSHKHIVALGDSVVAIAEAHGFLDHRRVWNHPDNAPLKGLGRAPTVLARGDEITVPELNERTVEIVTTRNHTFVLERTELRLRLKLCALLNGDPLANAACELTAEGATVKGTDGEGMIEEPVRATTRIAVLECDGFTPDLEVCSLEPVETEAGLIARLNNLGYYAGELHDGMAAIDPEWIRLAIEEFQLDQKVKRTGVADAPLRAMLKKEHGC